MKTMTTTGDAGTSITAWNYWTSNGLLLSKRYNSNSTGTTGSGPDYTYTSAGRLLTRSWAREVSTNVRVKATYAYTHGLLASVTYNDGTPGITYDYDAFPSDNNHIPGDLETVTRGGVTWTYQYDPTTLRLKSETHPVGGTSLTRVLTRHFDTSGRDDGFELGTDADPDLDHTVDYGHDTAGRFSGVTGSGQGFTYGYATGSSHLIHTVSGPADTLITNTWDPERDVLENRKNQVDSATVSQFTYAVNDLGQRTGVTTTGSAFGNTDRGWQWGYDSLGQAVKAVNSYDSDYNRAYVFDIIGNRTSAIDGDGEEAITTGYTPNKLNQYTAIDPGTEVYPVHDPDGNLLEDAGVNAMAYGLKYEWDAENRIVAVRKADDTLLATYDYDHLGRRIRTTTTAAAYQGASDIGYLYDGWNVVAEYTIASGPSIALHQAYTWGLDLSGTLQGAGGVGGLLCIHRGPGLDGSGNRTWSYIFMPFFDGNGNISEYIKGNGDVAAHFEYDPFGRLVDYTELTLNLAATFTYRFSTKPQGFESGIYYYGYRYYDPATGRWPSRDPIEERGGINLYGFVGNDGVNKWDYLGLDPVGERIWNAYKLQAAAVPLGLDMETLQFTDNSGTMIDLTSDDVDNYYRTKALQWDSEGKLPNDDRWIGHYIAPREPTPKAFDIDARGWVTDAGFWLATAKETSAVGLLFVRKCGTAIEVDRERSTVGFRWKDIIDTNPTEGDEYEWLEWAWQLPEAVFSLEIVIEITYQENRDGLLKVR